MNHKNYNVYYLLIKSNTMMAKLFQSGNSQAVRIPINFRLDMDTVKIPYGKNDYIISSPFKPKADMEF